MRGTAVFVDTSIQIARFVHSREKKRRIEERLAKYDIVLTSSVVRQEFKRRLLKEAQYLLNTLKQKGSFEETHRHVTEMLSGPFHRRKQQICLLTISTILEGATDAELTERARRYLRFLLRFGLHTFDRSVDHHLLGADCHWAKYPVRERKLERFDFGRERCSQSEGRCGVVSFLRENRDFASKVMDALRSMRDDGKTAEVATGERFLEEALADPECAPRLDPCLHVGDLMIALESAKIPDFYTMNRAESIVYCQALGQTLVIRPNNPAAEDEVVRL